MNDKNVILEAKQVQAGYGGKIIINDVSLQIHQGDVLSIIGPNGSGKSTLLKAMARLLTMSQG